MQLCHILSILWHCLYLVLNWRLTFSSPVEFSKFAGTECSIFTASSFRLWNSSTAISSPPLALFIVMLSKAHLTSHSRISGSRWVITPSWLSWSWRSFLYSSMYSYLFLLFFGTLHWDAYIFPFFLCFSLLFFSQLFVRPPQTAILLFCISFPWGWSWSLSPVQCHESQLVVSNIFLMHQPILYFQISYVFHIP